MYRRVVGRGPSVTRVRRIMHPSDFSPTSARAFVKAVEFAELNRAELLLVYVLAPIAPIIGDDYVASPRMYVDLQRAARAHGKEEIDKLVAKARKPACARAACCSRETQRSRSFGLQSRRAPT